MIHRRTALGLLGLLIAVLGTGACSTIPEDGITGERLRVTLHDYHGGARFELVSESYDDRLTYYSNARRDAGRKFLPDVVVDALIGELDDLGFESYCGNGPAPSSGGDRLTRGLEIQRDDQVLHWIIGPGSSADERISFHESSSTFIQIYNVTQSYQAVENSDGATVFDDGGQ